LSRQTLLGPFHAQALITIARNTAREQHAVGVTAADYKINK
jgi:hypothetical protein